MADHQDYTAVKPIVQEMRVELSARPVGLTGTTNLWAESLDTVTLRRELATNHASDDDGDENTVDPLSRSCFAEITTQKLGDCTEDVCDELTSLSWLQNSNLLRDFKTKVPLDACDDLSNGLDSGRVGRERDHHTVAITAHCSGHTMPNSLSSSNNTAGRRSASGKPPYSFACLIFMAIEESPTKSLPVKDIYKWIEDNFDYFRSAPTGWKNSVRHNLSLNKSFKRIDKQKGQAPGKGSLWTVDPINRISLLQALKKTHHQSFEAYISEHAVLKAGRLSRGSNSSASSDGDLESQSKRLCMEIAPDEVQAVEIMCSIANPLVIEAPIGISDTKSSSNCSPPQLVAPKATFPPTPATPATENRIQGCRQLTQHEATVFQPTDGSRRRNLFSTLATVATLTKDIEERLSRNNSARSSPVQTRRARAAKAAEEEMDTAILLHAAVAKRLAHRNGKKSPVDRDFDFDNETDETDRQQHPVEDEEEDELSASHTNGLDDSGYSGQKADPSIETQQQIAGQGMADILLEADKLLTMRAKQTQLTEDAESLAKTDLNIVKSTSSVVMQST